MASIFWLDKELGSDVYLDGMWVEILVSQLPTFFVRLGSFRQLWLCLVFWSECLLSFFIIDRADVSFFIIDRADVCIKFCTLFMDYGMHK